MTFKIYTKKGDSGTTQLIGGTRVPKYHHRIEAYGTIDELNSWVGVVRDHVTDEAQRAILKEIQDRLFTIGSHLATDPQKHNMKLPALHETDVILLENEIDRMTETLPVMKQFILPGGHPANSFSHIARCVCRRAERLATLLNAEEPVEAFILVYLNRLSDYLFVLSRRITADFHAEEIPWNARQ